MDVLADTRLLAVADLKDLPLQAKPLCDVHRDGDESRPIPVLVEYVGIVALEDCRIELNCGSELLTRQRAIYILLQERKVVIDLDGGVVHMFARVHSHSREGLAIFKGDGAFGIDGR